MTPLWQHQQPFSQCLYGYVINQRKLCSQETGSRPFTIKGWRFMMENSRIQNITLNKLCCFLLQCKLFLLPYKYMQDLTIIYIFLNKSNDSILLRGTKKNTKMETLMNVRQFCYSTEIRQALSWLTQDEISVRCLASTKNTTAGIIMCTWAKQLSEYSFWNFSPSFVFRSRILKSY